MKNMDVKLKRKSLIALIATGIIVIGVGTGVGIGLAISPQKTDNIKQEDTHISKIINADNNNLGNIGDINLGDLNQVIKAISNKYKFNEKDVTIFENIISKDAKKGFTKIKVSGYTGYAIIYYSFNSIVE